jgi:hypothetical protein
MAANARLQRGTLEKRPPFLREQEIAQTRSECAQNRCKPLLLSPIVPIRDTELRGEVTLQKTRVIRPIVAYAVRKVCAAFVHWIESEVEEELASRIDVTAAFTVNDCVSIVAVWTGIVTDIVVKACVSVSVRTEKGQQGSKAFSPVVETSRIGSDFFDLGVGDGDRDNNS